MASKALLTAEIERIDRASEIQAKGLTDAMFEEIRMLREDNAKLREALSQEREYHRQRSYPEPFKVGTVLGRYKDMSYALQILHVWKNWPNVDIEVGLPFAADGDSK